MTTAEIINTTVFETEDIMTLLLFLNKSRIWNSVKIRYLIKPILHYNRDTPSRWASIKGVYSDTLEIALLKPTKMGISPLEQLAQAADDSVAPVRLTNDLIHQMAFELFGNKQVPAAQALGVRIRIHAKPDKESQYRSAVMSLKRQLEGRRNSLERAQERLPEVQKLLAHLEYYIPHTEQEIEKLEARLSKRESKGQTAVELNGS